MHVKSCEKVHEKGNIIAMTAILEDIWPSQNDIKPPSTLCRHRAYRASTESHEMNKYWLSSLKNHHLNTNTTLLRISHVCVPFHPVCSSTIRASWIFHQQGVIIVSTYTKPLRSCSRCQYLRPAISTVSELRNRIKAFIVR